MDLLLRDSCWLLVMGMMWMMLGEGVTKTVEKTIAGVSSASKLIDTTHSCQCEISVNNSTVRYNLGTVKHIRLDDHHHHHHKTHSATKQPQPCHALRHRCHKACARSADLRRKINGSLETLGYHLCTQYDQVTPVKGVSIFSHAKIDSASCMSSQHHHHSTLKASEAAQRLCCGHTIINTGKDSASKPLKVFGWNPDCKHTEFVLGY